MKQGSKIVVADDNQELCELVTDLLGVHGHSVDTVNDGYELISYLEKNNPSIVILDLMMPEKGGISIFDSIKQLSPYSRIIIYTGYQEYEGSIYARNADRFLVKGTNVQDLVNAVSELT